MQTQQPTRVDLSNVATVLALQYNPTSPRPDLDAMLDYFEEHFDNYLVVMIEVGDRKFKYLRSKKNIQYLWLPSGHTLDKAVQAAASRVSRRFIDKWNLREQKDIAPLMAKYASLLEGKSPSDLCQSQQERV